LPHWGTLRLSVQGVTVRTSILADDGRYPLPVSLANSHWVFGLSSPYQRRSADKKRLPCLLGVIIISNSCQKSNLSAEFLKIRTLKYI